MIKFSDSSELDLHRARFLSKSAYVRRPNLQYRSAHTSRLPMRRKGNLLENRPRSGVSVEIPYESDAAIIPTPRDQPNFLEGILLHGNQAQLHELQAKYEEFTNLKEKGSVVPKLR